MAPFPDEVDVFTAPHWRMKQLVGRYCDKLSKTNFSNNSDFRALLQSLYATFKEFKMHEQIENEYIIGLLQQRSQTVYNVHSDNKLSEMLSLFEKGLRNVKNEYEQLNYAKQLKERLEAFTSDFLPHMKEEEEVFQPMLMEYFTYDELKDIKKKVIAQHCSHKDTAELLKGLSLWNHAEELQKVYKYSVDEKADKEIEVTSNTTYISHLPPEVMLKIFTYLNPQDLCRCSQVNTKWSQLTKTGSLWKHLYPVLWARGDWYNGPATDLETEPDEDWVESRKDESRAYQEWDEDADIDESEDATKESSAISIAQREKHLLHGVIHNVLPYVGSSVKSLVLAYSSAVCSKTVRQMLELCPNLEYLDLTQTNVCDSAFDGWSLVGGCQSLRHLDLSGCEKITDVALEKMSIALGILPSHKKGILTSCRNKITKNKNKDITTQSTYSLHKITDDSPIKGANDEHHWTKPINSGHFNSAYIWMLDAEDLADIEDAAEWRYRNADGLCVVETTSGLHCFGSGCCNKDIIGLRTSICLQRHCTSTALAYCGHSYCCAGTALRTIQALPETSRLCKIATRTRQSEVKDLACSGSAKSDQETARMLKFLSLSGCHQITDSGLRASAWGMLEYKEMTSRVTKKNFSDGTLSSDKMEIRALTLGGGLPHLEHLNLSGCLIVTGAGLQDLVSACPSLNDEHFYYCDNINGPHADTASGCQNLQCGFRACCRSGE
ncbi:F-box/LRR-repeat protein 5 isoform X1 [Rhinatrema bivittatum]|uniref:F-box/LRR-repeat protein 5 isoform X1 n=1 Tax=Rhinatrema bivittatum TaxID=194408 RepID=UPI001129772D|nr:F-box/LRR-repeat protein 5 isoform X1 [Rhinatrema bivittatum]